VSADIGGVATERGVVWFDDHEGTFLPLVFTQPPGPALYFSDERHFWYVIPQSGAPGKSVVIAIRGDFNDRAEFQQNPNQPIQSVRLDTIGLLK
jgi:hypothetical protein